MRMRKLVPLCRIQRFVAILQKFVESNGIGDAGTECGQVD